MNNTPPHSIVYMAAPLGPRPYEMIQRCTCGWYTMVTDASHWVWKQISRPKYAKCGACKGEITAVLTDPNLIIQYNLMNAKRWARWLMDSRPDDVITAPWILLCETLDDTNPAHRARGQRDDDYVIKYGNVDEICCVGGRLSNGMKRDAMVGHKAAADVRDLSHLGASPPLQLMPELFPDKKIVCRRESCFAHWLEHGAVGTGNNCDVCRGKGWEVDEP